jgi:phytoene dehydrogenase-like protein
MSTSLSVGIIGAGPGALALEMVLARKGFRDVAIFDREDGVGRSAGSFWGMTRRFQPADFSFSDMPAEAASIVSAKRSR